MDWKREAADKLKNYAAKSTSIGRVQQELSRLEADMASIKSSATDDLPVSGNSGITREDLLLNNIIRQGELKLARDEAQAWVEIMDSGLSVLDEDERIILDRFYIHRAKGNVERLCNELHLEKSRVYVLKDKALRHFTLALYGVVET